jgi:hypothetical protein
MPNVIRSVSVESFTGINELKTWNKDYHSTSSMDNLIARNGVLTGRKGIALWDGISAAATNQIIGFADFYVPASATSTLLRMQTLALEKWNDAGNSWDDVTGTALTGDTNTRPVFHSMSDEGFLVFTNEGHDRPRKYTGTGNSAVLGGTPPFAKWLCPYVGFLFLLNTSTDGTFGATADSITAYFSDVPDGSWDLCAGNTIIYDESPGEIRAAEVIRESLVVFKSDCIVQTRFTGGLIKFARKKLPFSLGILAPMSLKLIGEFGAIFLASDRNLYRTDGFSVQPLPPNVQTSLQEVMAAAKAPYCSAFVDLTHETYHLLFSRLSSTYFDGHIAYNYRTGEFHRHVYSGYEFTRGFAYRQSNNVDTQMLVAANDKKVYELESGTNDAGTAVNRFYDVDWTNFGSPGNKWLVGVEFSFVRARDCRVRVKVAVDRSSKFTQAKTFTLQGNDPDETDVRINCKFKQPVFGTWFKIRIEFFQDSTTQIELQQIEPEVVPVHPSSEDASNRAQPLSS